MSDSADVPTTQIKTNASNRYLEWLRSIPWTALALLALGSLLTVLWVGLLGWLLFARVLAPILGVATH